MAKRMALEAVSYTHLDVYKRQAIRQGLGCAVLTRIFIGDQDSFDPFLLDLRAVHDQVCVGEMCIRDRTSSAAISAAYFLALATDVPLPTVE